MKSTEEKAELLAQRNKLLDEIKIINPLSVNLVPKVKELQNVLKEIKP